MEETLVGFQVVYMEDASEFLKSKRLVVATHGFVKKTWKVSAKEIAKAEALRKEYYESIE